MARTDTLYRDDLVYVDVFGAPLIPGKVLRQAAPVPAGITPGVIVRLTADRPGYRRGEEIAVPGWNVIPRGNVRVVSGHFRVSSAVHYKLDETRPSV